MKRAGTGIIVAVVAGAVAVTAGCGGASYEARLNHTLEVRKEKATLDKYLNPAVEGKFQEEAIFLRTPKPLPGQPSDFRLAAGVTDAAFDIHSSFVNVDQGGNLTLGLHVLGRHKKPRAANAKGAPAPEVAERGEFVPEVIALLDSVHQNAASNAPTAKVHKKTNEFTRYVYQAGANQIEIYLFNRKFGPENVYDLALIWEYPAGQAGALSKPIDLTLGSMAVGPNAARAFESGGADDSTEGQDAGVAF